MPLENTDLRGMWILNLYTKRSSRVTHHVPSATLDTRSPLLPRFLYLNPVYCWKSRDGKWDKRRKNRMKFFVISHTSYSHWAASHDSYLHSCIVWTVTLFYSYCILMLSTKKNSPGVGEIFFSDVLDPRLMERPENKKCERAGNMKNVISEFSLQLTQIEPRISAIFIHTVERGYWCTQSVVNGSLLEKRTIREKWWN